MADIFEIKSTEVKIRINAVDYPLVDPEFLGKVNVTKDWDELNSKKADMKASEFIVAAHDLNKKTIKTYMPSLPDDILNKLSGSHIEILMKKIMDLSESHFGAVIEKKEQGP